MVKDYKSWTNLRRMFLAVVSVIVAVVVVAVLCPEQSNYEQDEVRDVGGGAAYLLTYLLTYLLVWLLGYKLSRNFSFSVCPYLNFLQQRDMMVFIIVDERQAYLVVACFTCDTQDELSPSDASTAGWLAI